MPALRVAVKHGTVRDKRPEGFEVASGAVAAGDFAGAASATMLAAGAASDAVDAATSAGAGATRVPGGTASGPVAAARAAVVRSANST